jgi:hypothetical protein
VKWIAAQLEFEFVAGPVAVQLKAEPGVWAGKRKTRKKLAPDSECNKFIAQRRKRIRVMIELFDIKYPKRQSRGREWSREVYGRFNADIWPGEKILIYGTYTNRSHPATFARTFKVGDEVEYHSWNLTYTGKLVAICPNTVTVDDGGTKHRMNLADFIDKNWDFDLDKINKRNSEWMD